MLLDLSGMTREERVIVQASINSERDFDKVADALIIQHPRIHFRESRKRAKRKGRDGIKRGDNSNTRWLQEKGKHIGSEKSGANANNANFTSVQDYGYDDDTVELADAYQAHNDLADPGSDVGEEALDCDDDKETTRFLHMLLWMMSLFSRQLNWTQLLFLPTRGTTILTQKLAHSSFGKEKGKGKSKGKGKFTVRPSCLPLEDRRQRLRESKAKTECRACGRKGYGAHDRECAMSSSSLSSNPQTRTTRMTTTPL